MSEKNKILMVDDSQAYVDLIRAAIGGQYDFTAVGSAEAGVSALSALKPDLILLDLTLPGMSGLEFARLLARTPETGAIPLIVLTANDYNPVTESLLRNEPSVKFFLTKLSPISLVIGKISEVLAVRRP